MVYHYHVEITSFSYMSFPCFWLIFLPSCSSRSPEVSPSAPQRRRRSPSPDPRMVQEPPFERSPVPHSRYLSSQFWTLVYSCYYIATTIRMFEVLSSIYFCTYELLVMSVQTRLKMKKGWGGSERRGSTNMFRSSFKSLHVAIWILCWVLEEFEELFPQVRPSIGRLTLKAIVLDPTLMACSYWLFGGVLTSWTELLVSRVAVRTVWWLFPVCR